MGARGHHSGYAMRVLDMTKFKEGDIISFKSYLFGRVSGTVDKVHDGEIPQYHVTVRRGRLEFKCWVWETDATRSAIQLPLFKEVSR
jgi:hypothetical protein